MLFLLKWYNDRFYLEIHCGDSMFTSSSGFIRLPSNPTEYSASVDCNYTISTNNASTFSIGILSLQLPQLLDSIADCDRDYIMVCDYAYSNRYPNIIISTAPLKSQEHKGTCLFTSAATNQRVSPEGSPR